MSNQATMSPGSTSESAQAKTTGAYDNMREAGKLASGAAKDAYTAAKHSAKAQVLKSEEELKELSDKAERSIAQRPFVAVGVAFAAGWLVSKLLK